MFNIRDAMICEQLGSWGNSDEDCLWKYMPYLKYKKMYRIMMK